MSWRFSRAGTKSPILPFHEKLKVLKLVKKYTQFVYKIDFNYDIFLNYNIFVSTVRTFHTSFFDLLRIISLSTK